MSGNDTESSYFIHHDYCIGDEVEHKKDCGSSDALAIYEADLPDGSVTYSGFCWSCKQGFVAKDLASSSLGEALGMETSGEVLERKKFTRKEKQPPLTKDAVKDLIATVGYSNQVYRGMKPEYVKFYGQLTKFNKANKPIAMYYPETKENSLWPTGYKIRFLPKSWGKVGQTGISSQLAGQSKFKDYIGHRDVLIVGGEVDMVSAYQMLRENQLRKKQGDYSPIAVVSPTTGETSARKQIQAQYDWLNGFENIILALDNDDAGRAAMKEICAILPKDKVRIVYWTHNDPNKMLTGGHEKQFMSDFYNAVPYVRDGIITSQEADASIEEELLRPKMSLPPFMSGLQKLMAGGIPLGYMVNWIAESGIGKSTLVNEAIRHWVYTSPYKVGILSLELTGAQYMIAMLSREVGCKINLFETPEEAVAFVRTPEVVAARKHLSTTEDGEARFVILDEREGDLEEVKRQCERLVNKYGCQVLIIDPIQDLFEGVSMDEQNGFLKWMKSMLKRGIIINNVCHVKKGNSSTDKDGKRILRELSEDDVHGISAIVKSAGANIFMSRDKYAESWVEKNTTFITQGKCRWTGITGRVAPWFYDLAAHTMYDLKEFFNLFPEKLPSDYDLDYNPFDKRGGGGGNSMEYTPKKKTPKSAPEPDFMDAIEKECDY